MAKITGSMGILPMVSRLHSLYDIPYTIYDIPKNPKIFTPTNNIKCGNSLIAVFGVLWSDTYKAYGDNGTIGKRGAEALVTPAIARALRKTFGENGALCACKKGSELGQILNL